MKRYWAMKWAKYLETPGLRQMDKRLVDAAAEKVTKRTPKCCLGHLEFMLGTKFEKVSDRWSTPNPDPSWAVLSNETRDKVGMSTCTGGLSDRMIEWNGQSYEHLAELNDSGATLKEIAQVIRANWRDL